MEIDKRIEELLSKEKGLKKFIRVVVYKAMAPLIRSNQRELLDLEKTISEHHARMSNLEINIRNNNVIMENVQKEFNKLDDQSKKILDYVLTIGEELKKQTSDTQRVQENQEVDQTTYVEKSHVNNEDDSYIGIDYFDFENRFRGTREHIKGVQEQYIKYFENKKQVVDIGCGRGEFLELLNERNINAIGVDLYGKSVNYCKLLNLNVLQIDAIEYLQKCTSIDGLFAGQVVEHLTISQIIQLCEVAYEKLEENCYMILETPNPTSLAIYTNAFYMDPSHGKPVHPLTLQYCVQKAGFKDVKILFTENSKCPDKIPKLIGNQIENLTEFNDAMEVVSNKLFGSQDYAIIARK